MTRDEQTQALTDALATIYTGAGTDEGAALTDWLDDHELRLARVRRAETSYPGWTPPPPCAGPLTPAEDHVVDLMAALEKSVADAKAAREMHS